MSLLSYKCGSPVSAKSTWFNGMTVPSADGIHCVNPIDPANWAYVSTTANTFVSNYNGAANSNVDPNLGSVANICEVEPGHSSTTPPTPPTLRKDINNNSIPYINISQDCPPQFSPVCPWYGTSINDFPGANSYGDCGYTTVWYGLVPNVHYWWQRDWDTELSSVPDACSTPANPTTSLNTPYCCQLDPGTNNRSQQCPPDVWGLSSKCYGPMTTSCAGPYQPANTSPIVPKSYPQLITELYLTGQQPTCQATNLAQYCDTYLTGLTSSPTQQPVAQNIILQALETWRDTLQTAGASVSVNDPMLPFVNSWCSKSENIGLCDAVLSDVCSTVQATELQSPTAANLSKACGCFMTPDQYLEPGLIPVECNAVCSANLANGGVPIGEYDSNSNSKTIIAKVCNQSNCVIDDFTLNLIGSQTGNIQFNQACGGCSGGTCNCIIQNVSENYINSSSANNIVNNCSTCTYNGVPVACANIPSGPGGGSLGTCGNSGGRGDTSGDNAVILWLLTHKVEIGIAIGILVLLLIAFLIYLGMDRKVPVETQP